MHDIKNKMLRKVRSRGASILTITMCITLIVAILFVYPVLSKAYSVTLLPVVPSGDDPAVHAYLAISITMDLKDIFWVERGGKTAIRLHYPNIIHVFLGVIYLITRDPLAVINTIKVLEFMIVLSGILLYSLLAYKLTKNPLSIPLTLAFAALLSRGILWTLSDGSFMELFDVLIIIPLLYIALLDDHYLIGGFVHGLSSLNMLGFAEVSVFAFPWFLSMATSSRKRKIIVRYFGGFLLGGNVFFIRMLYGLTIKALSRVPIAPEIESSAFSLHTYILHLTKIIYCGNEIPFYITTAIALLSTIICLWGIRGSLRSSLLPASFFIISWLMLYTALYAPFMKAMGIGLSIIPRWLRVLQFLSAIVITCGTYIVAEYILHKLSIQEIQLSLGLLKLGNTNQARVYRLKFRKHHILIGAHVLLLLFLFVFITTINPSLYSWLWGEEKGLVRIEKEDLQTYLHVRQLLMKSDDRNCTVVAICQVSNWLMPLLCIPEKRIDVFLITSPSIYLSKYSPDDPNRIVGLTIYNALLHEKVHLLERLHVKYLVVEIPTIRQWYQEPVKEIAKELWSKDFSTIASLIYACKTATRGVKVWRFKKQPTIELEHVRLAPGDVVVYHSRNWKIHGGYIVVNKNVVDARGNITIIAYMQPSSEFIYAVRRGYQYWLRYRKGYVELAVVGERNGRTETFCARVKEPVLNDGFRLYVGSIIVGNHSVVLNINVRGFSNANESIIFNNITIVPSKASMHIGSFPTARGCMEKGFGEIGLIIASNDPNLKDLTLLEPYTGKPEVIHILSHNTLLLDPTLFVYNVSHLLPLPKMRAVGNVKIVSSTPFMYVLKGMHKGDSVLFIGFPRGAKLDIIEETETNTVVSSLIITNSTFILHLHDGIYTIRVTLEQ